jgi:hypothetical protein
MEAPSPSYIITRALFIIALIVAVLMGFGYVKKKQRQSAIFTELQSITSDSSFFRQFHEEDAHKTLARAIGLIAEASMIGVTPDVAIDRGLGIKAKFFEGGPDVDEAPTREKIIRSSLRGNYENFLKLGYNTDFQTVSSLKNGELPPIPSGPHAGRRPEIHTLISSEISPGMEKVIANLEIRPPQPADRKPTAIEIAAARQLARDLSYAFIIEEAARDRILEALPAAAP